MVRLVRVCGRTRERGEREREEKEENKDDQVVLTTKFLFNTRAGPDAFSHKKMKTENAPKPLKHRENK